MALFFLPWFGMYRKRRIEQREKERESRADMDQECHLLRMPPELAVSIMGRLGNVTEVMACARVARLDAGDVLAHRKDLPAAKVLKTGAPLHIVRSFVAQRHPAGQRMPFEWLLAAVQGGQADVVAWMHEANEIRTAECLARWVPFATPNRATKRMMTHAAQWGKHRVLAWLIGHYSDPRFCPERMIRKRALKRIAMAALTGPASAMAGTLAVIHSARPERACSCPPALITVAAEMGRLDVLAHLYESGCLDASRTRRRPAMGCVLIRAVEYGRLAVARWAAERIDDQEYLKRLPMQGAMLRAASRGHARTLQFALDLGWDLSSEIALELYIAVYAAQLLSISRPRVRHSLA